MVQIKGHQVYVGGVLFVTAPEGGGGASNVACKL